jgi:FSR family fosmidomycin resistance protein-like MFS transporter
MTDQSRRPWWRLSLFVFIMLVVEFLDEFAYGAREAAWPLIRDTFDLSYGQIGLLLSLPILIATLVEPILGIIADTARRRLLIILGGVIFGLTTIIFGLAPTYAILMTASIFQASASGAFVTTSQAALMDSAPDRRENNMALWTFSGSLAVVSGPLLLAALVALGGSWRPFFIIAGLLMLATALYIIRLPANHALRTTEDTDSRSMGENLRGAIALLRSREVWRWLILLEFSNLMLDVMFGLLALYMVDVVGVTISQAGIAVAVWTSVGLLGDFLLIPILERIKGLTYLRFSVLIELVLFPTFLLVDVWALKLVILGIMGLFNAGWYAILQGKLYDTLGEQSGAVLIVGNAAGLFGALIPAILGFVAQAYSLNTAMWLLLAGPIALMIGLPRHNGFNLPTSDDSDTTPSPYAP